MNIKRLILLSLLAATQSPAEIRRSLAVPGTDVILVPESERTLDTLILGLAAQDNKYFQLPELGPARHSAPPVLEEELYGLNFELTQGALMRVLPERTQVYLGVPDRVKDAASLGQERKFFKAYLLKHCGWKEQQVEKRIHFFKVPSSLIWSQDAGQILGYDKGGHMLIGTAASDMPFYRGFLHGLTATYPNKFKLVEYPGDLSAEGGDENLAWLPDGGVAYVIGHNRILRLLANQSAVPAGVSLSDGQIAALKQSYSQAVYGIPVVVLPEQALKDPGLADKELFHLDMMVSFLSRQGKPQAFVPTYGEAPVDHFSRQPLDPAWVERMQSEFDAVAAELKALGYPVVRLPIHDHPVRSPVNVCKYYDPHSDSDVVLLGKYPYPFDDGRAPNGETALDSLLAGLRSQAATWANHGASPAEIRAAVDRVWQGLLEIGRLPNPEFDERKAVFEKLGYQIVPVPMFPAGAGSLHCLTLH